MTNGTPINGGNGYTGYLFDNGDVIRVHSETAIIKTGMLERLKAVPPFNLPGTTYRNSPAKPTMPLHLPVLGVYLVEESLGPDGDPNCEQARFTHSLTLGFSYMIADNDTSAVDDTLDAAHHAIMKLMHVPRWEFFPVPDCTKPVQIECITGGARSHHYGNLGPNQNLTAFAELRQHMFIRHKTYFEPVITDLLESMLFKAIYPWPEDPARQPVVAEWLFPQPKESSDG